MFTAFSISSIPRRMPIAFRRVRTPKSPIAKTAAASSRYAFSSMGAGARGPGSGVRSSTPEPSFFFPREVEGAQQRRKEEHREQFEREHIPGHQLAADRAGQIAGELSAAGRKSGPGQRPGRGEKERHREDRK